MARMGKERKRKREVLKVKIRIMRPRKISRRATLRMIEKSKSVMVPSTKGRLGKSQLVRMEI